MNTLVKLVMLLTSFALPGPSLADGGKARWSESINGRRVTVLTSPTPIRTGVVDVSVIVQDLERGGFDETLPVSVEAFDLGTGSKAKKVHPHARPNERFLRSTLLELHRPGKWEIRIQVGDEKWISLPVTVIDGAYRISLPVLLAATPALFIALFLTREHIVRRRRQRLGMDTKYK